MKNKNNNSMAWLCVDKDGTEKISINKPYRFVPKGIWYRNYMIVYDFSKLSGLVKFDEKVQKHKQTLVSVLPKGSIFKLINRVLTWNDEPVEI